MGPAPRPLPVRPTVTLHAPLRSPPCGSLMRRNAQVRPVACSRPDDELVIVTPPGVFTVIASSAASLSHPTTIVIVLSPQTLKRIGLLSLSRAFSRPDGS